MPTPDRTTIKAAIQELTTKLRANLVADPPTATKPFRRVEVGGTGVEEYARPFLTVRLSQSEPIGVIDDDKLMSVTMTLRAIADALAMDSHEVMLDVVGAVDDYLDSLIDVGVLDGADGFDDRTWNFEYPNVTSGARVIVAEAEQRFVVKVKRGQNRVAT